MPKIIRKKLSDETIEHIRELRSIAYKNEKLKCRRKDKKGREQDIFYWTDEDIDALRRLVDTGADDRMIGKALKRSWTAVRNKRRELRIAEKDVGKNAIDDMLDTVARKEKNSLGDGDKWTSFCEKMKKYLIVGMRYIVHERRKGVKAEDTIDARTLEFMGIVCNGQGRPFFLFRSQAGYIESFTIQQLRDCTFKEEVGK